MNLESDQPEDRPSPVPNLVRRWIVVSAGLFVVLCPLYYLVIGPWVAEMEHIRPSTLLPSGWIVPITLALPSAALGLLFALFAYTPIPARIWLRPTRARLMGCFFLWLILPVGFFLFVPMTAGAGFAIHLFVVFQGATPSLFVFGGTLGLLALCYVFACLLSSGLPNSARRAGGLLLLWLGAICALYAAGLVHTDI